MASAALGACTQGPSAGDEVGPETGESETGESETGESETDETGETDGGTTGVAVEELVSDENAPACLLVPGDHAEACASLESCPIVDDVELRCDDAALGDYGLSVAVDGEAVHVAVSGSTAAWLLATSGSQGEAIALPEHYATHHIELAQSLDGRRFVANMRSVGEDSDIVVTEVGASSFVAEQLVAAGGHVYELDFDDEGRAHVWFDAEPLAFGSLPHQVGTRHAERIGDASWWQDDAREWATTYVDFALSQGGSPVMASLEPESEWFQLSGTLLGHELALYDGHVALRTPLLAELPKPDPLPVEVEPYVLLVGDDDHLVVVWPDIDGWQALPLPGTAPDHSECVFQCPCPSECHDVGEGVPGLGYAIARTSDASVWVAWILRERDIHYDIQEDNTLDCTCVEEVVSDFSTATLHVARIDGHTRELTEMLVMPIGRPDVEGSFKHGATIDLAAYGDRLGLALTLFDAGDSPSTPRHVRVLGLEF